MTTHELMIEGAAAVRTWLCEPLPTGTAVALERLARSDGVRHVAVMPDVHLAEDVCIGTAVASSRWVYPTAVGGDIGCGVAAIRFDADRDLLAEPAAAEAVLVGLAERVPSNRHSRRTMRDGLPRELADSPLSDPRLEAMKDRDGRVQLGTLGRGNHFVELQADGDGALWLAVHSGSRGIGQAIARHHFERAVKSESGMPMLDADTEPGRAYLADAAWAGRYAAANRLAMVEVVVRLMEDLFGVTGARNSLIHTDHNHVREEPHFGEALLTHRKGAAPADEGQENVIPGSMGTATFHVTGRGCEEALRSSSHGAGRALPRAEARRAIGRKDLERQLRGVWYDRRMTDLLRDEAPAAYRDIGKVMRVQRDLVRVVRELRPVLCYKGR